MVGLSSIFGGSSPNEPVGSTESSANLAAKAQLKKELEVELATANLTELVSKLSETCFEVCPTSDDVSS